MIPQRYKICEDVYFRNIKNDKFKTGRISVTMFIPLNKATIIPDILFSQIITRSCEKYPDYISFNNRLNEMYGASLSAFTRKVGESIGITFSVSGLDDRFILANEQISRELTELLCEILFRPRIIDGAFAVEDFEQEHRELLESIYAQKNEKRSLAISRCIQIMCKNELYGISKYNSLEAARSVTAKDVCDSWKRALSIAKVDIVCVGMFNEKEIFNAFQNEFLKIERTPCKLSTTVIAKAEKITQVTENDDVTQAKLVMGFRTPLVEPDCDITAMRLAIALLGEVQNSKLFINVREKQSLCYYCVARYMKNKGIVLIDSGVENENVEKAKTEILHQIELMKSGDISDDELKAAKLDVVNGYRSTVDGVGGLEYWFVSQLCDKETLSVEQACDKIMQITKEDIVKAIATLSLDTVFVLKRGE